MTVDVVVPSASTEVGLAESDEVAAFTAAGMTVTLFEVFESVPSVAVTVRVPAVLRLSPANKKMPESPGTKVWVIGRLAAESVEEKLTEPV